MAIANTSHLMNRLLPHSFSPATSLSQHIASYAMARPGRLIHGRFVERFPHQVQATGTPLLATIACHR